MSGAACGVDEFTVKEFVELTKNSYGGEIIKKIERMFIL